MTFLTELRKLNAAATETIDSTDTFCNVGEAIQKRAKFLSNNATTIAELVRAAQAVDWNRQGVTALSDLRKALAALDKEKK